MYAFAETHSTLYNILIAEPFGLLLVLVTAFVGIVALVIYYQQNKSLVRVAALELYSEIQSAENTLTGVKARFFAVESPVLEQNLLIPNEKWSAHKHMFLAHLSEKEWRLVDKFYTNCAAYDKAVTMDQDNFSQIFLANHKHLYDKYAEVVNEYHSKHPDSAELDDETLERLLNFEKLYLNRKKNAYDYVPVRSIIAARTALVALDTNVLAAPAGQKLRSLAGLDKKQDWQVEF